MEFADIYKYKLTMTNTYNRNVEDAVVTVRGYGHCYDVVDVESTYRGCELLEGQMFEFHYIDGHLMNKEAFIIVEMTDGVQYFNLSDTIADVGEHMDGGIVSIWSVKNELLSVNEEG